MKEDIEFIRPKGIILNKGNGDIEGIIEEKIFLGSILIYNIQTESKIYKVQKNNDGLDEYSIGDRVYISLKNKKTL